MPYLESARLCAPPPDGTERDRYPFNLLAVQSLSSMRFDQVTILVGDNGTGKSTLIEALAIAAGFNPEGGSRNLRFDTDATHSELSEHLVLRWNRRPRWGWFLRAETFYGMAAHIHRDDDPQSGVKVLFPDLHDRSHGESFLALIMSRMHSDGLYVLDEPESALSFQGQLQLLRVMHDACAANAQFLIATHSPLLMAFPGATIYELDDTGARVVPYDDLDAVGQWRAFLRSPERYFRYLFEP